jgi:cytochrome P450
MLHRLASPLLNPLKRHAPDRDGFPTFAGTFPLFGHMPAVMTDYLGLVRRAAATHGPMFWLDMGFGRMALHATQPEAFQLFKHKSLSSAYLQQMMPDVFGISIIAQDDPTHRHMRSAMNPPFLPRGLSSSELGATFAEMIEKRIRTWPDRGALPLLSETRELVLSLMFRMLGVPESEIAEWRHQYEEFMLLVIHIPFDVPGSPRRRGTRARNWLRQRLLAFIADARRHPERPGLLGMLVHARDENGEPLSEDELVDNLRLLVLAGHETSASTMAWIVAKLAEHPHVWQQLCAETKRAGGLPRTPKELRNFPYAEAVFRETLRLHPPVSNDARRTLTDVEFDGRRIPAGTDVTIPIIHLSRLASQYPEPDVFRPERWLGRQEALSPIELIQFGGGPHFCLGYHVAWMEIVQFVVAVALVLERRGLAPRLPGGPPRAWYLPLLHPSASTRVAFA